MLTITITSYDESDDTFTADCDDSLSHLTYPISLPASIIPYIAHEACCDTDDLPHGLVDKSFTLTNPVLEVYAKPA